ncbi:uncharacterized protein J3R85_005256 [Psidium guajava]|nr:uncharacterized protein J3R85_005256 [Psidium guajava]
MMEKQGTCITNSCNEPRRNQSVARAEFGMSLARAHGNFLQHDIISPWGDELVLHVPLFPIVTTAHEWPQRLLQKLGCVSENIR